MVRNDDSGRAETGSASSENDVISTGPSFVSDPVEKEPSLVPVLIVLVAIVVGLVVLGKLMPEPPRPPPYDVDPEVHFRCQKCSHEYIKDRDDLTEGQMFSEADGPIRDDCPKCGAARSAIQLAKCPKCEKYYLPKFFTDLSLLGQPGSNICEHCKIDVDKWYMDEAKSRRKTTSRAAPRTRPQGGR